MNTSIHTSHCCPIHGCKYGDEDCPVVAGKAEAEHQCEDCSEEEGEYDYYLVNFTSGKTSKKKTYSAMWNTINSFRWAIDSIVGIRGEDVIFKRK